MTGEIEVGRMALASSLLSIREFERSGPKEPFSPLSFFFGNLGAADVARRVGIQFDHGELVRRSESMLKRVTESADQPHIVDVIGGHVGPIPVLLPMRRDARGVRCRERSVSLDEELRRLDGDPVSALAQLRAASLNPGHRDEHLRNARLTLGTTIEAIDNALASPRSDTSLGHGLSGLGEVLVIAGELLGETAYHDRATALARTLTDRHAPAGDWPSATPSGGPNPSLMLGLAGVGYWLLRVHDPTKVPSFLLLVP
jgi:lantibiotic modifying enzyme